MSALSIARGPAINADIQVRQAPPLPLSRVTSPTVHRPALNAGMAPLNRPMSAPLPLPRPPAGTNRPAPVVVPGPAHGARSPQSTAGMSGRPVDSQHHPEHLGRDIGRASERALPPSRELREARMIRDLARRNGCALSLPFDQKKIMSMIYQQVPGLGEHLTAAEQSHGCCFGLSLNWLKNAADGHNDAFFAESLQDWSNNSLFLRTIGLQFVGLDKARAENGENDLKVIQAALPGAGLEMTGAGAVNLSRPDMNHVLKQALEFMGSGAESRYFVLVSDTHAMALRKDESGRLHFFDPNGGVISSDSPDAMKRMLRDTLLLTPGYWHRGQDKVLQIVEAKPSGGAQG